MTVRLHNPQRSGTRRKPSRKNPAELVTLGFINPQRGTMSKSKEKSSKKAARRRPNPFTAKKHGANTRKHSRRSPRKSNPAGFGAGFSKPVEFVKLSLFALIGLVIARQVPQVALKQKNTGLFGYGANFLTTALAGYGAGKFISKPAGAAVAIGGGLYLVNRILSEQLSPIGQYLSLAGTGDAIAAPTVGRLQYSYFPFPVIRDPKTGSPRIPKEIDAAAAVAAAAPKPAAAATVAGRLQGSRLAA